MVVRLSTFRVLSALGVAFSVLSSAFVVPRPLITSRPVATPTKAIVGSPWSLRRDTTNDDTALRSDQDGTDADGYRVPSPDKIKLIKSVMANTVVDGKPRSQHFKLHIIRAGVDRFFVRGNKAIYGVLEKLRNSTPSQDIHLDEVNFSDKVQKTLFFETISKSLQSGLNVGFISLPMKWAPYMEPEDGEIDYESLYGDKFLPYGRMMISDCAEHCFLNQAEAFCHPESTGSDRLVCDLNYLQKYAVKSHTPARYGGLAVVQGQEITEISGIKAGTPGFEKAKAIFLSSFAVHLIVVRHAILTHLAISQRLLMKLTTKTSHEDDWEQYQDVWKQDDGANLLLRALTTRTNGLSIQQQLLVGGDRSLLGRATSFTDFSLVELGTDMYDAYSSMTPDELIADVANAGMGKWPIAVNAAWQAAQECVNEICKDLVKSPAVKQDDLTDAALMLWVATFYHGFIGDFQLDNINKGMLPLLLTGEPHKQTLSYATLSTTIGVTTMTRTVNMVTLEGFFPHESQRKAWNKYTLTLRGLDVGVKNFSLEAPVYAAVNF